MENYESRVINTEEASTVPVNTKLNEEFCHNQKKVILFIYV